MDAEEFLVTFIDKESIKYAHEQLSILLNNAYNKGYNEGYDDGYDDGIER